MPDPLSISFLVFCCVDIKEPSGCSLPRTWDGGEGRGEEDEEGKRVGRGCRDCCISA